MLTVQHFAYLVSKLPSEIPDLQKIGEDGGTHPKRNDAVGRGVLERREGESNEDSHCHPKAEDNRPEDKPDASLPRYGMGNEKTTLAWRERLEFRQ